MATEQAKMLIKSGAISAIKSENKNSGFKRSRMLEIKLKVSCATRWFFSFFACFQCHISSNTGPWERSSSCFSTFPKECLCRWWARGRLQKHQVPYLCSALMLFFKCYILLLVFTDRRMLSDLILLPSVSLAVCKKSAQKIFIWKVMSKELNASGSRLSYKLMSLIAPAALWAQAIATETRTMEAACPPVGNRTVNENENATETRTGREREIGTGIEIEKETEAETETGKGTGTERETETEAESEIETEIGRETEMDPSDVSITTSVVWEEGQILWKRKRPKFEKIFPVLRGKRYRKDTLVYPCWQAEDTWIYLSPFRIGFLPRKERSEEGQHCVRVRLGADRGRSALRLLSTWKHHRSLHGQPTQVLSHSATASRLHKYILVCFLLLLGYFT